MTSPIEDSIFSLLAERDAGKTICPSEVARTLHPEEGWNRLMPQVRAVAVGLARQGRLVITRKGKAVDPNAFKGVYRLRLPAQNPARRRMRDDRLRLVGLALRAQDPGDLRREGH